MMFLKHHFRLGTHLNGFLIFETAKSAYRKLFSSGSSGLGLFLASRSEVAVSVLDSTKPKLCCV